MNPEVVHPDQYLMNDVDPLDKAQYPDVATVPLMHHTSDKNQQDLAVCLVILVNGKLPYQRIRLSSKYYL